ncbi:MAG: hypothetical protein KAG66_04600, partial [Methylococcales bacterium]|nr:hypothetical protein [Methylococcales bacterium]
MLTSLHSRASFYCCPLTDRRYTLLSAPLWDRCLSQLEVELSEQQLNTWIRPLQAKQNQSQLCIMAPNRFVLDMVQNNFQPR